MKWLRWALTLFVLGFLIWEVDLRKAVTLLGRADPLVFGGVLVNSGICYVLAGLRWKSILLSMDISIRSRDAVRATFASVLTGQVMPSSVLGEWMRYRALSRKVRPRWVIESIALDRGSGLVIVVLLCLGLSPFALTRHSIAPAVGLIGPLAPPGTVVMVTGVIALIVYFTRQIPQVRNLFSFRSIGYSLLITFLLMINYQLCLIALGANAGFFPVATLFPYVLLATAVPIFLSNWGLREVSALFILAPIAGEEVLVSASLLYGAASAAASVPGAFFLNPWDKTVGRGRFAEPANINSSV